MGLLCMQLTGLLLSSRHLIRGPCLKRPPSRWEGLLVAALHCQGCSSFQGLEEGPKTDCCELLFSSVTPHRTTAWLSKAETQRLHGCKVQRLLLYWSTRRGTACCMAAVC